MRYLCMVCYEQKALDDLSQPEFDALVAEALAYDDELRKGGHYRRLQSRSSSLVLVTCLSNSGRFMK